jgi:hypothetical protein
MAIDKEFLAQFFQGVEKADEHIGKIIAEFEKANLPLVKNRDEILAEKKAVEKKAAELQEKFAALETANKELNEKLESNVPDKEKQIYAAEVDKLKSTIAKLTEDFTKSRTEYEGKIEGLSKEKKEYIIGEEFTKIVNSFSVKPTMRAGLTKIFFADNPRQGFEPYEYGGNTVYVNKDGKKMADLLNDYIQTDEGKNYVLETNNGGGATGSSKVKPPVSNPWAKETLNLTEQMKITKENPTLANSLKEQAKAKT